MDNLIYAGIGSRETPEDILTLMSEIGVIMQSKSYGLRTGGAKGADQAFASKVDIHHKQIILPWNGYENHYTNDGCSIVPLFDKPTEEIAAEHHPVYYRLSKGAQKMMMRNVNIILGSDLNLPAQAVICWTKEGQGKGGTGHAIRVADYYNIPIFDLALEPRRKAFMDLIS